MTETTLRVLLVDDEQLSTDLLSSIVSMTSGFTVAGVRKNGREAIDALHQDHFDIVLMDIQMPGLTGLEAVERTQADRLPAVIFATAYDEYACKAFDLHAVDYIVKPFDPERVQQALERAAERVAARSWMTGKDGPIGAIAEMRQANVGGAAPQTSTEAGSCRSRMADTPICSTRTRSSGSMQQGITCASMPRAPCISSAQP